MQSKFDKDRDQRIANDTIAGYMPCSRCKAQTLRETLSQYGARCQACYERFCQGDTLPIDGLTRADKIAILAKLQTVFTKPERANPKAWAYALRDREKAGETLSLTQRTMYRAAIGRGDDYIPPDDLERTTRLKAETQKRVTDYARRNGLSLADATTLIGGHHSPARDSDQSRAPALLPAALAQQRAHALDEPAWVREGEGR